MKMQLASALALTCLMALPLETCAQSIAGTENVHQVVAKAGEVGQEQLRLAAMAGNWNVHESLWMTPDSPPIVASGKASLSMKFGGRRLLQNLHIKSKYKDFVGVGYIGYDDIHKRYYSTWFDNTFNGLIVARGDYESSNRTYSFSGSINGKNINDPMVPLREVLKIVDNNDFTFEYLETRNGRESMTVKLEYSREL